MERQLSDQEIDAKLTNDRLRSYIRKLVENCVDIEDEDIIEKTYNEGIVAENKMIILMNLLLYQNNQATEQ